jgi:hypothetical protein
MQVTRLNGALTPFVLPPLRNRADDEGVLQNMSFSLGLVLMFLGMACIVVAVFRALGRVWTLGLYELWVLPTAGLALILLGRWLIQ